MNNMTDLVVSYIDWKRARGFKIEVEGKTLLRFAEYADKAGWNGGVGVEIVDKWIESFDSPSDWYKARLYETVKTFSSYAAATDPRSVTLPRGCGNCHGRTEPYIYSGDEMCIMIDELSETYSPDGLRSASLVCMVGLMWCTGMRPKEVIELGVSDYARSEATIVVRASKFHRTRLVPLSDDCALHIEEYLLARSALGAPAEGPMFLRTGGMAFDVRAFEYAWMLARKKISPDGKGNWQRRPPRLYDIRHSFCTWTIKRWLEAGEDVDALMPYLSTYVGHRHIEDTYWYLTGAPPLMALVSKIFEDHSGRWS